jgi:hypothetical protein
MSEVERLRQLAANYLRMADLTFREDIRNGLLLCAAQALERAHDILRQETAQSTTDSVVKQTAQQGWR